MFTTLFISCSLLLLATSLARTGAQGPVGFPGPIGPPDPCRNVVCRQAQCADPVTLPGKCCPSCANSKCQFEGCVQLLPTPRWLPTPCKICYCFNGVKTCGAIGCPGFPGPDPCFGNPLTGVGSTPSVCCPRCDFGVPETSCRAVPYKRKSYTLEHGSTTCSGQIEQHRCDKIGYRKDGKLFRCEAVMGTRYPSISGCDPFTRIAHRDVRYCRAVEDPTLSGAEGCDFIAKLSPKGIIGFA